MAVYVPKVTPAGSTSADLIEQLGAQIAARYAAVEAEMIRKVAAEAAKEMSRVTEDLVERYRILAELRRQGEQIAANLADQRLLNEVIAIAAADGEAAAIAHLGLGGPIATSTGISGVAANAVGQIALDLGSQLEDMSGRITRWMPDAYQHVISMIAPQMILGVSTFQVAQAQAVSAFLARGVGGFTDNAGKNWRIGTYAEMATRTAVHRANMDANIYAQQDIGINLVAIVTGVSSCKKCAAHAGKIYSTDGTPAGTYLLEHSTEDRQVEVTVAGTLDGAKLTGWNHPNCRCTVVAYLPGFEIPRGTTYSAQAEADRDKLRGLERSVRQLKRQEAAQLSDTGKAAIRKKIRVQQGRIRDHVDETGILRRNYREQLHFSDGKTPPATPPAPRAVTSPPKATPPATTPRLPRVQPPAPTNTPGVAPRPPVAGKRAPVVKKPPAMDAKAAQEARKAKQTATKARQAAETGLGDELAGARANRIREVIKTSKPAEIGEALNTHYAGRVTFEGFDTKGINIETAREVSNALVDMLEKYPEANLESFAFASIRKRGVLAHAMGLMSRNENGISTIRASRMEFSLTRAKSRSTFVQAVDHSEHAGFFHPTGDRGPGYYTVVHEFGHVMDYSGQRRARHVDTGITSLYAADPVGSAMKPGTPEHRAWVKTTTSGYGHGSTGERIAEGFADAEVNGATAKPMSTQIRDMVARFARDEAARKATP